MPAVMYRYEKDYEGEEHILIICSADPSKQYDILKGAFERAEHISTCDEIILGSGSPPPWWYIVAENLLNDLYKADNLVAEAAQIIRDISSFEIEENGKCKPISYKDMRKIVDAMSWIHQKGLISYAKDEENIDVALRSIRIMIYRKTR